MTRGVFTLVCMALALWPMAAMAQAVLVGGQALTVVSVDSQETVAEQHPGMFAVDGAVTTFWHTAYSGVPTSHPHTIVVDLGKAMDVYGVRYLPRQDGNVNGGIANFAVGVSSDGATWTDQARGTWAADATEKTVRFAPVPGRYVRLQALSEVKGQPFTSAAEVGVWAAQVATGPTVMLAWDAPVPAPGQTVPDGYVVMRRDSSNGAFTERGRTVAPIVTYTDTLPAPGTYWYRVHSAAGTQVSGPSNEVSVTLSGAPGAPQHLTVTVTGTAP